MGERLRASPRLRRSLFGWLALGLIMAEAFSLSVAQVHGGGWVIAGLLTLAGWLVVSLALAGGAAMLVRPDGSPVDVYGVPNGLSAIRAWLCPVAPLLHRLDAPRPARACCSGSASADRWGCSTPSTGGWRAASAR